MINHLFVYGTLLHPIQSNITNQLQGNSTLKGHAYIPGRLFDLGSYPGLIWDKASEYQVYGQIFSLHDPLRLIPMLDLYEGIHPKSPGDTEYVRVAKSVSCGEEIIDCWMYLYNRPTDNLPEITSGNYLDYVKSNPNHQRFIQSV